MKLALASTVLPARDAPPSITLKIVTMAREGIEVIQANNRRVAAAKKAAALTAKNLQAAKDALEAAQRDHDEATEELKDAEESQKAAQRKWEVVDLVEDDDDDEEQPESSTGSKKRAEASSDSAANASKKVRSNSTVAQEVLARSDINVADEITVEGCGVAGANGSYKRYCNNRYGAPQYSKEGQYKGEDVRFEIYRKFCWVFGYRSTDQCDLKFKWVYFNRSRSSLPPSDGWVVFCPHGVEPTPKIT